LGIKEGATTQQTSPCFLSARAPVAAGAGCVDDNKRRTLRPQLPEQLVTLPVPSPDRAEGDDLRAMGLGDRGDRQRLCMDIHANVERARL